MSTHAYLETRKLCKRYGSREVVRDVDIRLGLNEIVGLLGPNGAGKTTTFNMIVGLTKPTTGEIWCNNKDISRWPIFKRARFGIGYLPQESSVFRRLTVEENLKAILETLTIPRKEQKRRLEQLLRGLRIDHLRKQKASSLSGGERRRLEITRTMITSPSFLLLDEPFSGIDPISVSELRQIITQLKEIGIGILLTDHNVSETLKVTDRAYIIESGRVLFTGSPESVAANPKVREVYLGKEFKLG